MTYHGSKDHNPNGISNAIVLIIELWEHLLYLVSTQELALSCFNHGVCIAIARLYNSFSNYADTPFGLMLTYVLHNGEYEVRSANEVADKMLNQPSLGKCCHHLPLPSSSVEV